MSNRTRPAWRAAELAKRVTLPTVGELCSGNTETPSVYGACYEVELKGGEITGRVLTSLARRLGPLFVLLDEEGEVSFVEEGTEGAVPCFDREPRDRFCFRGF